jgi:hypothetical protein
MYAVIANYNKYFGLSLNSLKDADGSKTMTIPIGGSATFSLPLWLPDLIC